MPGSDGVLLLGLPTLKDLGVDPYERIWDSMQHRVSPPNQGVETPAFLGSRRVSLSVAALQEAGGQATEEPDLAVERLVVLHAPCAACEPASLRYSYHILLRLPRRCFCCASVFLPFPFALDHILFMWNSFVLSHLRGGGRYLLYLILVERSEFLIATSPPQNLYFVRVFD